MLLGQEVVHVVVVGGHALPVEVTAVHGARAHLRRLDRAELDEDPPEA